MNWDDLRFVLELSRTHTLSAAAVALGATHTTVRRRLRSLEEDLGVKLFEKTSDGFVLTTAGADVVEVAHRTERDLLTMEARVSGGDARLEGPLRVTTMDLLFSTLAPAFRSFANAYPGISLTLHLSDERASLNQRSVDVAMRLSNAPPDALVGRRLFRLDFAVYGSCELIASVESEHIEDYPWLSWHEQSQRTWLEGWLAKHAPKAQVCAHMAVTSMQLREVVASGLGVHFLACRDADADPRLRRLGPVVQDFSHDVWLLTLPELRHQARVRAFMNHMYEGSKHLNPSGR